MVAATLVEVGRDIISGGRWRGIGFGEGRGGGRSGEAAASVEAARGAVRGGGGRQRRWRGKYL